MRYRVLEVLHDALGRSDLNQTQLAERLGKRKSAISQVLNGDGNVTVNTLAHYLAALGYEAELALLNHGELDAAERERREPTYLVEVQSPTHHKRRYSSKIATTIDDGTSTDAAQPATGEFPLSVPNWAPVTLVINRGGNRA
jgi:transcriptional regulator with XRE-family HTH domain